MKLDLQGCSKDPMGYLVTQAAQISSVVQLSVTVPTTSSLVQCGLTLTLLEACG